MELGPTGMRESAVMATAMPDPDIDDATGKILGWSSDPYDPSLNYDVMRNLADDRQWDSKFPDHVLTRARSFLDTLESTTTINDNVMAQPQFGT